MRFAFFLAGVAALALAGCGGPDMAKVKGQIVENGQPKTFPPTSHSVEIAPVDASGSPDNTKMFTAVVNADGSFEVLASGGQLPAGPYPFTVRGPSIAKKGLATPPGAKRELKGGDNAITLDLAKPSE